MSTSKYMLHGRSMNTTDAPTMHTLRMTSAAHRKRSPTTPSSAPTMPPTQMATKQRLISSVFTSRRVRRSGMVLPPTELAIP